ncbi:D-aminoacylase [Nocardioides carbamazepini]|uniref:N-acyl-D-amino-acid deacylase family protein n=1 Tax=Nocardioides carbamazepini TaxID=2854259 RepID=UPI002149F9A0|nr:D-aminoacylase [Nocardioides carbamazepini]MCR1783819.1 D-aminoacylase [Nocardioides carbamazepini]
MKVDVVIRGGEVVDGTGAPPYRADVAILDGRITAIGTSRDGLLGDTTGIEELDATSCLVSPGFVNVLSHAYFTIQQDPRGLSDLYQGVTTEVFGEGVSLGPVTGEMTPEMIVLGEIAPTVRTAWPSSREFLDDLERRGVGQNVATFVGAANLRMAVAGLADEPLDDDQLARACGLLRDELETGALGVGSALIYPPGSYAGTRELIAYAHVLAEHDALYISHLRNEGDRLEEAVRELLEIARETGARAEIYHLKTAGRDNWHKMPEILALVEDARDEGLRISADIYPYVAGSTGITASIPPQFHRGGIERLRARLRDPATRARVLAAIREGGEWESLWRMSGGADGVVILSRHPELGIRPGTSVADIARERGDADPVETLLDIVEAAPYADAAYFLGDEDNLRSAFTRPWVSVGSDSDAPSSEDLFADHPVHPRAFGAFARVIGRYARDEGLVGIGEAVRRVTSLPASNLRLADRGEIRRGYHADIAVFDLSRVADRATYADPKRYATGMRHVLVNGVAALRDGAPTGLLAGRALRRGPARR